METVTGRTKKNPFMNSYPLKYCLFHLFFSTSLKRKSDFVVYMFVSVVQVFFKFC